MSMDFVYDLTDKLEEQRIDYFLVTIRTGVKTDAADVFYHFKDESSIQSLINVLHKLEQTPDLEYIRNAKKNKPKKQLKSMDRQILVLYWEIYLGRS